jgi:glycosyltransferase involved in cell wall biosynthesis
VIHVHSVPDFEVFATVIAKLRGARIILDIHDLVPELYAAKFRVSTQSLGIRMLTRVERWSTSYSDFVIAANDLWRERLVERCRCAKKCMAFLNYPDLTVFRGDLRTRYDDGKFVMIYPGTLNWHQGVDIAVRAFSRIAEEAPSIELHIYGEGPTKADIERLIHSAGLEGRLTLRTPLPLREIAKVMANADLGIVPKRDDAFGGEAFSTKVLEFMALGVPVLVAGTRIDRHYFDVSMLRFFTPGDEVALASAMLDAYFERTESLKRAANALDFVGRLSWARKRGDYLALVQRLTKPVPEAS